MKKVIAFILSIIIPIGLFAQKISIGERYDISSKILNDNRTISVYYPPSYFFNTKDKYPVLYILDGDYNFQYVAGLLELWGGISEDIPEMILVGISGKGSQTYRKNCKPNVPNVEDPGNADDVIEFLQKELIPFVDTHFKSTGYKILAGHSVGGIFVTYTSMVKPRLFNQYIAISPALWWGDEAIGTLFEKMFQHEKYTANIYLSLANEKGMCVKKFVKTTKKRTHSLQFKQFPDENHNSVGNKTYQWALQDIFKNWKHKKGYFKSKSDVEDYFELQKKSYGQVFRFPSGIISYTLYALESKEKTLNGVLKALWKNALSAGIEINNQLASHLIENEQYQKANQLIEEILQKAPNNFKAIENLAKLHLAQGKNSKALDFISQSIQVAKQQKARQWMINELLETKTIIEKK